MTDQEAADVLRPLTKQYVSDITDERRAALERAIELLERDAS